MTQFPVTPDAIAERQRQQTARMRANVPVAAGAVQPLTSTRLERRIKLPSTLPTIGSGAPDSVQNAVRVLDALRSHAEAIVAESKRLGEDRTLSLEGRKATLKKFADARVAAAVKTADRVADGLKVEVAVLKDKLPKLNSLGNTSSRDTVREIEARADLAKQKPTRVFQLFREAIDEGDPVIFYAVANANKAAPLVEAKEQLEKGKRDFLRNKAPEAFKRYDAAVDMLDILQTGGAQFVGEVQEHVAALFRPKPKPIQTSPYALPHGGGAPLPPGGN